MNPRHTYSNTRARRFWTISLFTLIAFTIVAFFVISERATTFDILVTKLVRGLEHPSVTWIAKGFTYLGSSIPIIVICLVVFSFMYGILKSRRESLLFLVVVIGSALLNVILKQLFQRVRPDVNRLIEVTGYSFPSGHSMASFTLYGILTYLLWKHLNTLKRRNTVLFIFSLIILAIGLSRIYLGVHYPSDVVGGYLASCTWLMFSIGIYETRWNLPA